MSVTRVAHDLILSVDSATPLSSTLVAECNAFCDRVEDSDSGRVVQIQLHGDRAAGEWPGNVGIDLVTRWEKAVRRLERVAAVSIATVEGVCSGPALEVLLTSDCRIGMADLRIDIPVYRDSVWAGMFVHRLANQFGAARTRQLVLFGAQLTAEQAVAIGLVDEIAADPTVAVAQQAERCAGLVPDELAIRRRLLLDAGVTSFEEALGMHLAACDRTLRRSAGNN